MSIKVNKAEVTASTKQGKKAEWVKNADGTEENEESEYGTPVQQDPQSPFAWVGVDKSLTKNLGNYESMRMGVSITVPCDTEDASTVFDQINEWTNDRLMAMSGEVDKALES